MTTNSKFIENVSVTDPDTEEKIQVFIYKELESGRMFGVEGSYLYQVAQGTSDIYLPSPYYDCQTFLID